MTEISIEVAFATPEQQVVVPLVVAEGTTIEEAVRLSGLAQRFPHVDFAGLKKGIWNTGRPDDHIVQAGDRVEIYRPLVNDAKEARRQRAKKND